MPAYGALSVREFGASAGRMGQPYSLLHSIHKEDMP